MAIFDFLKPRKKLTGEQLQWNRMWSMWCRGEADSPYGELMTYLDEVTSGGHARYFANTVFLQAEMEVLDTVLPPVLRENLRAAFAAHEAEDDERLARCDEVFGQYSHLISDLLRPYAQKF